MNEASSYKLAVVAPVFPVTDVRRAVTYYRDALLFDVGFEWSDADNAPVRYVIVQSGDTELHLSEAPTARETVAYIFVDGVAAYYDAVLAAGARVTAEIEDHPWQMREFEVADPDGNRIIFGEHLSRLQESAGNTPV